MSLRIIYKKVGGPKGAICHMWRSDWPKEVFVELPATEMWRVKHWLKELCITCVEERK